MSLTLPRLRLLSDLIAETLDDPRFGPNSRIDARLLRQAVDHVAAREAVDIEFEGAPV